MLSAPLLPGRVKVGLEGSVPARFQERGIGLDQANPPWPSSISIRTWAFIFFGAESILWWTRCSVNDSTLCEEPIASSGAEVFVMGPLSSATTFIDSQGNVENVTRRASEHSTVRSVSLNEMLWILGPVVL